MHRRSPPILLGDAPGLDFLNSLATPVDTQIDWIDDGQGYLDWLQQAHLVPPNVLRQFRARSQPGELDKVADQARKLREWFRGFLREHSGRPLTADALAELEPLNRLLDRDESFYRIVAKPAARHRLELQTVRRWHSSGALLLPVAEALAQLACSDDFPKVKACEGATCTLLFIDRTRGQGRRWCSMAICGNRAKQAAHRERLRAER